MVPEADHPRGDGLGHQGLEVGLRHPKLLVGVRDEPRLHEDRRHVGAGQHPEGRLPDRPRTQRNAPAQLVADERGQVGRRRQVARLGHLPRDHVDVADAAAGHRQVAPLAFGQFARLPAVLVDAEVVHLGSRDRVAQGRVGVQADEQVRAVVVGRRGAPVRADERVAGAGQDDPHAQAAFQQRAQAPGDAQRDVLLQRPFGAARAFVGAPVARVDHDGADLGGRAEVRDREDVARGGLRPRFRRLRRLRLGDRRGGRLEVDHELRRRARFAAHDAVRGVGRPRFDGESRQLVEQLDGPHGVAARLGRAHEVDGVGVEAHEDPAVLLGHLVGGVGRDPQGQAAGPRPRAVLGGHPGRPDVAHEQEPRAGAQLDPLVVDARERAAEEVERDEPAPADPPRRGVERHELPVDRRQGLPGRQDDRPAAGVDGEGTLSRILADVEPEQRGELVEGDRLAALHVDGGDRPPALRRDQRQPAGRLLGGERKHAGRGGQDRDGRQGAGGADGRRPRRVKH